MLFTVKQALLETYEQWNEIATKEENDGKLFNHKLKTKLGKGYEHDCPCCQYVTEQIGEPIDLDAKLSCKAHCPMISVWPDGCELSDSLYQMWRNAKPNAARKIANEALKLYHNYDNKFKEKVEFHIGDNPELSKKVQEKLFTLGYRWSISGENIKNIDCKYLYADTNMDIMYSNTKSNCNLKQICSHKFLGEQYVTKKIDYTDCHPVIADHLKRNIAIKCLNGRETDFIYAYDINEIEPYIGEKIDLGKSTKPILQKLTTTYVKKASKIIAWLEEKGDYNGLGYDVDTISYSLAYIFSRANKEYIDANNLPKEWLEEK